MSGWIEKPQPLEEVDPELGELLRQFCNGELKPVPVVGRNEPCPICLKNGKKIKWKKCREHNRH